MKSGQGFPTGPGDPSRPSAHPRTLEEIQRRTPQVAGKVEVHHYHGGTIITPSGRGSGPDYVLPFHPVSFAAHSNANSTATNARLKPGWVLVRHIESLTDTPLEEPLIGSIGMWDTNAELTLAGNVSYNYLHCNTNQLGFPQSNWNIVSSANIKNSNHYIPPDPEGVGGQDGDYWFEIFRTNFDSSNVSEHVQLKWGGHFSWSAELWAGTHPAWTGATGEARPYKEFDEAANRHRFRTHFRGHGHNVDESGAQILHKFYGANICNSLASGTGKVYTGNTLKDAAEFVCISERVTDPQVRVTQADNEAPIFIQGNNRDGTVNFTNCNGVIVGTLTYVDGLWTSLSQNIPVGECDDPVPTYTTTETAVNYTVTNTDTTVLVDNTTQNVFILLPDPTNTTFHYHQTTIKKTDASVNQTHLRPTSSTIDGTNATRLISSQYESLTVSSNGTAYHIVNKYTP